MEMVSPAYREWPINRRRLPRATEQKLSRLQFLSSSSCHCFSEKMSCCGCGSGCSCSCGGGCGGCKMFPDLGGERGATAAGITDLGVAAQKGSSVISLL
ncbi:hypothetical protein BHM03_00043486 [Ensete ventricosum]|nr:hypothetical protein BHM03_00043486 [Ensete ventricosum]